MTQPTRSFFESEKYDSYLSQQWQMHKCRQLVLKEEKRGGFEYVRVGRIRPDLLLWPVGETVESQYKCFTLNGSATSSNGSGSSSTARTDTC